MNIEHHGLLTMELYYDLVIVNAIKFYFANDYNMTYNNADVMHVV